MLGFSVLAQSMTYQSTTNIMSTRNCLILALQSKFSESECFSFRFSHGIDELMNFHNNFSAF